MVEGLEKASLQTFLVPSAHGDDGDHSLFLENYFALAKFKGDFLKIEVCFTTPDFEHLSQSEL